MQDSSKLQTIKYTLAVRGDRAWLTAKFPAGQQVRVFKYDPNIDHELQLQKALDDLNEDIVEKVKFEYDRYGSSELWLKK